MWFGILFQCYDEDAGRGARRMVAVDPRPDPSQSSGPSSLGATRQPPRCLGNLQSRDGGGVEPNINVAKCQCSQGSRVRHDSSRSRGWGHQGRTRSCVEARQGTEQVSTSRAPVPEVTFEAARVRVQKLEAALLALADFPGPEVNVLEAALTRAKAAAGRLR